MGFVCYFNHGIVSVHYSLLLYLLLYVLKNVLLVELGPELVPWSRVPVLSGLNVCVGMAAQSVARHVL